MEKNNRGELALHLAATNGCEAVTRTLLEHGTDVNVKTSDYQTALSLAVKKEHRETVRLLTRADDIDFGVVLQQASARDQDKMAELLLSRGADVNAQGGVYGNALHAASYRGHDKVVELLLSKGAVLSPRKQKLSYIIFVPRE